MGKFTCSLVSTRCVFKRVVEPGDQIRLEVEVMMVKRGIWKFKCRASVEDQTVTTAELMCTQKAAD